MDWTMYIAIGLCVLTIGSLVMNYFNYVEINNLRAKACDNSNQIDYLDRRCIQDLNNTDARHRMIRDQVCGIYDTLKHKYLDKKEIYAMWDIHNARVNSYYDEMTRQGTVLRRLEPVALLADKIDLKRRIKASKEYQADLESDLKETERELKGIA
jgi:hypothetical protein